MVTNEEEFLTYMKVIREEFDFIYQVKSAVANEEWELLRCIVEETPNEVAVLFSSFELKKTLI